MIIRKQSLLLSYNCLQCLCSNSSQSSTSCISPRRRIPSVQQQSRSYAKVVDDTPQSGDGSHIEWPDPIPPHKIPNPYQILDCKKGIPYENKRRFYELVKLYHPDRNHHLHVHTHLCRDIPYSVRLERYRLIVAAHAILSDPVKRSAYDHYGAGWLGGPEFNSPPPTERRTWEYGQDPMQNATWEDWERWHARQNGEPQQPVFVSNGTFVAMLMLFVALGGIGQATRAGNFGSRIIEHRETLHSNASKELRLAREAAARSGDRNERIQSFLRHREANLAD